MKEYDEDIHLLTGAARCALREGRRDLAVGALALAASVAERAPDPCGKMLQQVALALAEAGQHEEAERLAERAVASCEAWFLPDSDFIRYARRMLEKVRATRPREAMVSEA